MPILPTSETNKTKQDDNFDEDANNGAAWTLFVLSLCYVHNSVATFVLPAILPQVSADLHLTDAQAFLFQPPAVGKPSLCLALTLPAELDASEALPELLKHERQCQQWEQLVAGVHDIGQSKGNPWWATIVPELSSPSTE